VILAAKLKNRLMEEISSFITENKLILGICNGFQVLTESGLLPGALTKNKNLKFICENVNLCVSNSDTPFTNFYTFGEIIKIPIAHMDGNYFIDDDGYNSLIENNQIIFKYCDKNGSTSRKANPNGSVGNIAGITNIKKNVLGMMPHPERCAEEILNNTDGLNIFKSIKNFIEKGEK
jgi:phosphoribosylformylglycinamidine synthase